MERIKSKIIEKLRDNTLHNHDHKKTIEIFSKGVKSTYPEEIVNNPTSNIGDSWVRSAIEEAKIRMTDKKQFLKEYKKLNNLRKWTGRNYIGEPAGTGIFGGKRKLTKKHNKRKSRKRNFRKKKLTKRTRK